MLGKLVANRFFFYCFVSANIVPEPMRRSCSKNWSPHALLTTLDCPRIVRRHLSFPSLPRVRLANEQLRHQLLRCSPVPHFWQPIRNHLVRSGSPAISAWRQFIPWLAQIVINITTNHIAEAEWKGISPL